MTEMTARVTARRMARAAEALLQALDAPQRGAALFPLEGEDERRRWSYYPREFHGLPLLDMTGTQAKLVHRLLESALSIPAHAKVSAIMALESVLGRLEDHARFDRDPARYYLSFFGDPAGASPWGWRFEGHHVSLHFTLAGDILLGWTPSFLGSNPARLTHGGHPVLRVLGEEEDLARELVLALDEDQRGRAIISPSAPPDFVLVNAPAVPERALPGDLLQPDFPQAGGFQRLTTEELRAVEFRRDEPAGISGARLEDHQRDILFRLMRVYLDRLPDDAAGVALAELDDDASAGVHFAWAGGIEPRAPHYYRIQGPRFLVEYDNTQNNVNHIHAVWRDPQNDFGDLLRKHYLDEHPG